VCWAPSNNVFVFGHSLADSDEHILRLIERGRCNSLFVSIYGDPDEEPNAAIIHRAELMAASRDRYPLEVHFYDAASAGVWG
jgi:hypothetical protein